MADKELVAVAKTTTLSKSDNHKRKLEDLEQVEPYESLKKDEAVLDSAVNPISEVKEGEEGENEAQVDGSESKRPRLDERIDDIDVKNGQGDSEEKQGDNSEVEDSGEKPVDLDTSRELDDCSKVDDKASDTNISEQHTSIDHLQAHDVQKSNNNDKPPTNYNSKEPCKGEDHEPSSSDPQQADAPNDQAWNMTSETQTLSQILEVPNNKVGVLIGKGGETIRHLQFSSGARIQITRDSDSDPRSTTRPVELIGTLESVVKAEKLIKDVIAEADVGGSPSLVAKGYNPVQSVVGDQIEMKVPIEKVGLIIGKSGETIKNLQARSGTRIQLVQLSEGEQVKERTVRVTGERKKIDRAREMIQEVMDQRVRARPPSTGSSQQSFRPNGPVAPQWGPPPYGPVQNQGIDFQQRGPYPSPTPQQHPAPVYSSYPPHPAPPRCVYGTSWGQRRMPPMQQRVPPPPSPPQPQANYNYSQPHQSFYQQPQGQNYGHPGYMPPPMMPQQGGFTGQQPPRGGGGGGQTAGVLPTYSQPPPHMGYAVNMQPYPMQQTYPQLVYPQQQPVSGSGYGQPPAAYPAAAAQTGQQPPPTAATYSSSYSSYSSYPSQPPADVNVGYGYQPPPPPPAEAYGGGSIPHQSTAAMYNAQPCYAHSGYDQSVPQSGGYVVSQPTTQPAATTAATSYGNSA